MSMDKSRTPNEAAIDFVSKFNEIYFHTFSYHLSSFVQDGFLKNLFEKNPSVAKDKVQLLIEKFGKSANPTNFTLQAQATNIQPTTLSLIFSIALYSVSRTWKNFAAQFFIDMNDDGSDDMLDESSEDEPDEDEDDLINLKGLQMPPNPVLDTPLILLTVNKQVKHQSTMAKPNVKTSAKNSQKEKKSSEPEATQILTGYKAVREEQERI
jgi:hypothetical protein